MADVTQVEIPTDDGPMPGWRWSPPSGRGPGLVLFQEIFGVSDYIKQRGSDLADLGYVVVAPELYWRLPERTVDESRDDFLQQAMGLMQQLDGDVTVADGRAALAFVRADADVRRGVGVIGFCFGGGVAYLVAAADEPDALVSYYGSAIPGALDKAPQVTAPSLHHFGLADSYIDADTVARIESAVRGPGVRFETYPGADHAFDNPRPMFHHPDASARAWQTTVDFLREVLPVD